jgi:hypothetical protein
MANNKNYYTSSNYATLKPILTREEFHRYVGNTISDSDFNTDHTNGFQIEKVASAIKWTIKNSTQSKSNKKKD